MSGIGGLSRRGGRPAAVCMADLVGAVAREYRKLGRLCLEREFGPGSGTLSLLTATPNHLARTSRN